MSIIMIIVILKTNIIYMEYLLSNVCEIGINDLYIPNWNKCTVH